jgi:hypothetical protein
MEPESSPNPPPLRADLGRIVEVEMAYSDGEVEILKMEIVPDAMADFPSGYLGAGTPLARALAGHTAGEKVAYPVGDTRSVRILSVVRSPRPLPAHIASQREEAVRKIVEEVDRTNIINFASSFNGKWGDYDPDSLTRDTPPTPPSEG